jgi:hypothetical protein
MLPGKGIGAMIVGGDPFFNSEREWSLKPPPLQT